jgi:hypothetical protein
MIEFVLWILMHILASAPQPAQSPPREAAVPVSAPDFARDVRPILEKRCQPCHFEGGRMHAKLPFDRPETVDTLGTKLFSRIKEEGEQKVLRAFLARPH